MYLAITTRSFLQDKFARQRSAVCTAPDARHIPHVHDREAAFPLSAITHRCWSLSADCSSLKSALGYRSATQNGPAGAVVRSGGPTLNPSDEQSLGEASEVH